MLALQAKLDELVLSTAKARDEIAGIEELERARGLTLMSNDERWLAEMVSSFQKAHPRVAKLDFNINESAFGNHESLGQNPIRISLGNVQAHYRCPNPNCKDGGLDFDGLIRNHSLESEHSVAIDDTFACPGYEIKPTGRNSRRACDNYVAVKGSITLKPKST